MKQLGSVEAVRNFVANLKIDKKNPRKPLPFVWVRLSCRPMIWHRLIRHLPTMAYKPHPFMLTHITDKMAEPFTAIRNKKSHQSVLQLCDCRHAQICSGSDWQKYKSEIAGKTGTTNSYKDGWYVGFTPNIVVSTWVGGDAEWIRFNTLADGQGAVMARPFLKNSLPGLKRQYHRF